MLGLGAQRWSSPGEGAAGTGKAERVRKRHRARHTKSRQGCFPCKLRRVKCDEARPVCGACSSRGEQCAFPDPATLPGPAPTARKSPTRRRRNQSPQPEPLDSSQPQSDRPRLQPSTDHVLPMDDLRLIQFYHLHTAAQMAFDEKRRRVWERVRP